MEISQLLELSSKINECVEKLRSVLEAGGSDRDQVRRLERDIHSDLDAIAAHLVGLDSEAGRRWLDRTRRDDPELAEAFGTFVAAMGAASFALQEVSAAADYLPNFEEFRHASERLRDATGQPGAGGVRGAVQPNITGLAANSIRVDRPCAETQAAFPDFMRDWKTATFQDVAEKVHHDASASDNAIRQNMFKVNEYLEEKKYPIRFRSGSGRVPKREDSQ